MKLAILENGTIDLAHGTSGLIKEEGLESAVLISLLTDRRANPDDALPDDDGRVKAIPADRRGWCGDALSEDDNDDRIGSRLWLLVREKQTEETRRRAIHYANEALEWLIEDGIASTIEIEAEWEGIGRLNMLITIYLIDGEVFNLTLNDILGDKAYAV